MFFLTLKIVLFVLNCVPAEDMLRKTRPCGWEQIIVVAVWLPSRREALQLSCVINFTLRSNLWTFSCPASFARLWPFCSHFCWPAAFKSNFWVFLWKKEKKNKLKMSSKTEPQLPRWRPVSVRRAVPTVISVKGESLRFLDEQKY